MTHNLTATLMADLAPFPAARVWGIVLWVGLGILTTALFVLGRTRWGQAKPLSKCVVLSLFAHVLLGAYAYGTKLIFAPPSLRGDDGLSISLLEPGELHTDHDFTDLLDAPWNEFPTSTQTSPDVPMSLPRPTLDRIDTNRDPLADVAVVESMLAEGDSAWSLPGTARPTVELPGLESQQFDQPAAAPSPVIETPRPASEFAAAIGPEQPTISRQRRGETTSDAVSPDPNPLADSPDSEETLVQRLADALAAAEPSEFARGADSFAEAANHPVDTPDAESANASNDRASTVGDESAPAGMADASESAPPEFASTDDHRSGIATGQPPNGPPLRLGDGQPLPEVYQARLGEARAAALVRFGGNAQTEAAVDAALAWLAAVQSEDGRWDPDRYGAGRETSVLGHDRKGAGARADTGITALALLAFLGAGHTHLEGQYRTTVQRGLEFLLRSQASDGNLAGDAELFARMYCHGMAALAVNEALALTGDHRLQPCADAAIDYTLAAQHLASGGWRYQPGDQGDMSQFGWQVLALKSAELRGREIPELNRGGMVRFVRSASAGQNRGLAAYRAGERPSVTMTAESLVCRMLLNTDRRPEQVDEAVRYLMQDLPADGKPNLYYWYYGTLALFQIQGEPWQAWNEKLQTQLLRRQSADGPNAGSWSPDTMWGGYGGRVYSTALGALCLEAYYRYLPIYGQATAETDRMTNRPRSTGDFPSRR